MDSNPNTSSNPQPSSGSFFFPHFSTCSQYVASSAVFTSFTCTSFLFLIPLCGLVLVVGIQQWWNLRRSPATSTVSHSDFLTYNIIALEMIGLCSAGCFNSAIYKKQEQTMRSSIFVLFTVFLGRLLFQCLTCVEQYLAVIHPVIYLSLKTRRGIRVRNGIICVLWLMCLGMFVLLILFTPHLPIIPLLIVFVFGLLVISFCTLSVFCGLVRPKPGDTHGDRKGVDQPTKKVLLHISVLAVAICLKYIGILVCISLHASSVLKFEDGCVVLMSSFWFCLPSSLLMPLHFLNKAGKLPCFSGKGEESRKV